LKQLEKCIKIKDGFNHGDIYDRSKDEYNLPIDIKLFQKEFKKLKIIDKFRMFDNLKTLDMLKGISIDLELEDGTRIDIEGFSDGQFQSIYIYAVTEIFKELNCLTLLDEPDAFLHPEWQFKFFEQVYEITNATSKNNHVLMSSHSAVTLVNYHDRKIRMFVFEGNQVKNRNVNKKYAIDQLSSNMIQYSENEQILSILRNINIEQSPVLFTEGSTDPDIVRVAWQKLYREEPMPFIPIYAFNCVYLRQLFQDERIHNELNRRPAFAMFDFDEAYNEWNALKSKTDTWNFIEKDPYKGLCVQNPTKNLFAFLLPVPGMEEIEKQVISDKASKTHYAHESRMGIEHLFYNAPNTGTYFETQPKPGGAQIIHFKGDKTQFAKEVVRDINPSYFEVFRPIFDFIKSKC
jgi:energy-coupling factor transporter ATP-binding protein EcfA2